MITKEKFMDHLDSMLIGDVIYLLGVTKISSGGFKIDSGQMVLYTGRGGVWDYYQAFHKEAQSYGQERESDM